ncbi:MAG: glucose-6-phosphate dehydrogenase assembly protein OpcA [Spirochaetes bacterium]|nr:glucose-6-phosphate dehydrogenase assembly protein OpcA [Spirochaetota bacterium]
MKALFDPERIERDLRLLEREYSLTETRTVLFNLVIFANNKDMPNIEENFLVPLLGKRAARIIRISLGNTGETTVSVSARCAPDREDKGVCFQEILIENGSDHAGIAPGSWSAFLIRDLPVYVLWYIPLSEEGSGGPMTFAREQADKFLLDGEFFLAQGIPLKEYLQKVKKQLIDPGVQVTDFPWERIRPLRIFTAQVFDQKALLDLLPHVTSLEVTGPSALSLWYYYAWVCTVLEDEGKKVLCSTKLGKEVQVVFRFRDSEQSLVLKVDSEGLGQARFGTEEILVKPLKTPTDGSILLEQVDIPIADPLYRRVMESV